MLTNADHVLVLAILVGLPVRAYFSMRALRSEDPAQLVALRRRIWTNAILSQWLLAGCVVALVVLHARGWGSLLLELRPSGGLLGILVGLATMISLVVRQRGSVTRDPEIRARVRERLSNVQRLLPASRAEYPHFAALACTAGLCEELLFRGYLFWYGSQFMPVLWAAGLQAVLFGVGHFYQGPRGMLLTGLAGVFFTAVTFVSGSIWPAMLIHALMDLNAGDLGMRAFAPETERSEHT